MRPGPDRDQRLAAYWRRLADSDPLLQSARRVRFYSAWISVIPEDQGRVVRQTLIDALDTG